MPSESSLSHSPSIKPAACNDDRGAGDECNRAGGDRGNARTAMVEEEDRRDSCRVSTVGARKRRRTSTDPYSLTSESVSQDHDAGICETDDEDQDEDELDGDRDGDGDGNNNNTSSRGTGAGSGLSRQRGHPVTALWAEAGRSKHRFQADMVGFTSHHYIILRVG